MHAGKTLQLTRAKNLQSRWDKQEAWDPKRPLKVVANGRAKTHRIKPSLESMLELVRQTGDRGQLFHAFVDLSLSGDARKIPEPQYNETPGPGES